MMARTEDGREFESWEALVESEANGWVATAILRERAPRQLLFTWTVGPFSTKREAANARNRMRARYRRQEREGRSVPSDLVAINVRPAWKDV